MNKLEEIKAQHAIDCATRGDDDIGFHVIDEEQCHEHRAWLIAEVDSLNADVARLNTAWQSAVDQAMENGSRLNAERAKVAKLREGMLRIIESDRGFYDGPEPRFVTIARQHFAETQDKP